MGIHDVRECPCGSGKDSEWQLDGRGIPLDRTCEDCHEKKMARYNKWVFGSYDESDYEGQIEEDY